MTMSSKSSKSVASSTSNGATPQAIANFLKQSMTAAESKIQHVLFVVGADGQVKIQGTNNLVGSLHQNGELLSHLEGLLKEAFRPDEDVHPQGIVSYPPLPCSPFGSEWNKLTSAKLRAILTAMIQSYKYTRTSRNKTHTKGPAPEGWPEDICAWDKFEGSYRSHLEKPDISAIIVALLRGANCDPARHVDSSSDSYFPSKS